MSYQMDDYSRPVGWLDDYDYDESDECDTDEEAEDAYERMVDRQIDDMIMERHERG